MPEDLKDLIAEFVIPTVEDMHSFGNAFGALVVRPIYESDPTGFSYVIDAYGLRGSGKSHLLQHIGEGLNFSGTSDFWNGIVDNAGDLVSTTVGEYLFRWQDFGWATLSQDGEGFAEACHQPVRCSKGLDLFEHAPLPHLRQANVLISVADQRLKDNRIFFADSLRRVKDAAVFSPTLTLNQAEQMALQLMRRSRDKRKKDFGNFGDTAKIVTIGLPEANRTCQTAFGNFKSEMSHYSLI